MGNQHHSFVKKIAENRTGRDFVLGDIHGAFHLAFEAMSLVDFDPLKDRIFSVGDLIDRGPYSDCVCEFLRQPFVHAVRGNHEQALLDLYSESEPSDFELNYFYEQYGLGWWANVSTGMRHKILREIERLPYVIEVQTKIGAVGITHAEVPLGLAWGKFTEKISMGDQRTIEVCLNGRRRINTNSHLPVSGITRVFVGHTISWAGVRKSANVFFVDTGAVFGRLSSLHQGHITILKLDDPEHVLCSPRFGQSDVEVKCAGHVHFVRDDFCFS